MKICKYELKLLALTYILLKRKNRLLQVYINYIDKNEAQFNLL